MNVSDAEFALKSGQDPYSSESFIKRSAKIVISLHLAILFVPAIGLWIWEKVKPEPEPPLIVMKVGLVDLPEGDSLDVPPTPTPPTPTPPTPAPPEPTPAPPEPTPPQPPEPTPPEPTPPKPPEPTPPKPPEPTPPKEVPVPPKEVQPKPKPKPNYLTADDIKKQRTHKVVKPDQKKINAQRQKAEIERQRQEKAAQVAYQKQLAEYQKNMKAYNDAIQAANSKRYGVKDAGLKGILATAEDRAYWEKLKAYIDQRFVQPSDSLLNGQKPQVDLQITIGENGELKDFKVVSGAGIPAMDAAVASLKEKLRVLPKPPRAMTLPVTIIVH